MNYKQVEEQRGKQLAHLFTVLAGPIYSAPSDQKHLPIHSDNVKNIVRQHSSLLPFAGQKDIHICPVQILNGLARHLHIDVQKGQSKSFSAFLKPYIIHCVGDLAGNSLLAYIFPHLRCQGVQVRLFIVTDQDIHFHAATFIPKGV